MRVFLKDDDRFLGYFVGINPITDSVVVYVEDKNTYKTYHDWQVEIVK